MEKKNIYKKNIVKPNQKVNNKDNKGYVKKKVQTKVINKEEIDFNTNIYKQYCDKNDNTTQKEFPTNKTKPLIMKKKKVINNNKSKNINTKNEIEKKEIVHKEQEEDINALIEEYNSTLESKNNKETTEQPKQVINTHDTIESIDRKDNIQPEQEQHNDIVQSQNVLEPNQNEMNREIETNNTNNQMRNNSLPTPAISNSNFNFVDNEALVEKIRIKKKQEEYKKMLDEQNEQNRIYKAHKVKEDKKIIDLPPIVPSKSTYIQSNNIVSNTVSSFPLQAQKSQNVHHYQDILNHFCDDKLNIMNEIKNTKQNKTLQKYQEMLNQFVDRKIHQVNEEMKQRQIMEEVPSIQQPQEEIEENIFNIDKPMQIEEPKEEEPNEITKKEIITTKIVKKEKSIPKKKNQKEHIKIEKRTIKTSMEPKRTWKQHAQQLKEEKENKQDNRARSSNVNVINSKIKIKVHKSEIDHTQKNKNNHNSDIILKDSLEIEPQKENSQEEVIDKLENIQKYVMNLLSNYKE